MHIYTQLDTTLYAAAVFFVCASYENFAAISGYLSPTTYTTGAAQIIDWAPPDLSHLFGMARQLWKLSHHLKYRDKCSV